jgi:hypothetical protein
MALARSVNCVTHRPQQLSPPQEARVMARLALSATLIALVLQLTTWLPGALS